MRIFDPHIHMTSRTTNDYEAMYAAGVRALVEPAFWLGQPRTHAGSFEDYFLSLVGWERFRASQFGIRHFCTMALNPREANDPALADDVLAMLPRYLEKDGVVAVGEIGYDDMTPAEDRCFAAQIELAHTHHLPVLIHLPHRDKKRGCERTLALVKDVGFPPERTIVDHNTEETLPLTLASGCWAGHSIYPHTKMDEPRMVALVQQYGAEKILVNSAADWGVSDPLKVPKTRDAMRAAGIADATLETLNLEGFSVYVVTPSNVDPDDQRVYLDIHGGAWIQGGGEICKLTARLAAGRVGTRVWAVDYRMPPDHPYPIPLDDCVAAYQLLLPTKRIKHERFLDLLTQRGVEGFPVKKKENPPSAQADQQVPLGQWSAPVEKRRREYQSRSWLPSKSRDLLLLYTLIVNKTITPCNGFQIVIH